MLRPRLSNLQMLCDSKYACEISWLSLRRLGVWFHTSRSSRGHVISSDPTVSSWPCFKVHLFLQWRIATIFRRHIWIYYSMDGEHVALQVLECSLLTKSKLYMTCLFLEINFVSSITVLFIFKMNILKIA